MTQTAPPPDDARRHKADLRALAKSRRAAAHARHDPAAGAALASHGLGFLGPEVLMPEGRPAIVSGFSAIGDEIDPQPLMLRLAGAGHPLALPTMQGKGKPLVMRGWTPGDTMAPAVWGIAEPLPTRPEVRPSIVLVPLLAFDAAGYRLGYGGGFYDRTLEGLRAGWRVVAVGIAYDEQCVEAVPHAAHDERLDWVLTPSGPRRCGPDLAS